MGFFSRLATFFNIRANAALDKAEDPGQVMDYSYSKQVEQLQQLRLQPVCLSNRREHGSPSAGPHRPGFADPPQPTNRRPALFRR